MAVNHHKHLLPSLAILAVVSAFIVIAMGAYTRLADAGLGCPDWPTCYGHVLWPQGAAEIDQANIDYAVTPVVVSKTWPEQVHRLLASSLGLLSLTILLVVSRQSHHRSLKRKIHGLVAILLLALIVRIALTAGWTISDQAMYDSFDIILMLISLTVMSLLAWLAYRQLKPRSEGLLLLAAFIVAAVILQGLFGMWTVTLKVWPQVVTGHLLGGFTVVALFWLLSLHLVTTPWHLNADKVSSAQSLQTLAIIALLVIILQVALGGWTTSNYAAVACPDFPTCQNSWWPSMDFQQGFDITQGIGPNYLGGVMDNAARMAIHMAHRIGALITCLIVIMVAVRLLRLQQRSSTRFAILLLAVLGTQVLLGLANIILHFPIAVAVAHNAMAAILLLTMITLNYRLQTLQTMEYGHE